MYVTLPASQTYLGPSPYYVYRLALGDCQPITRTRQDCAPCRSNARWCVHGQVCHTVTETIPCTEPGATPAAAPPPAAAAAAGSIWSQAGAALPPSAAAAALA